MDRRENTEEINRQVQSAVEPMTKVVYDMNMTLKEHIQKESDRITSIDDRLDKHLVIYANNGKESARVADALERIIESQKINNAKTDEMYDIFRDLKGGKKTTIWAISGFMFIGSAYLLAKNILK